MVVIDDIVNVVKVLKHPRRIELLNIICSSESITANEMMDKLKDKTLPQYLYSDLNMMIEEKLIKRQFSEESKCFVYSSLCHKITINLNNETIERN